MLYAPTAITQRETSHHNSTFPSPLSICRAKTVTAIICARNINMTRCYEAVGVAAGSTERMASRISRWTAARDGATIISSQIEREPQVVAPPG